MSLADLIRGRSNLAVATATVAIPATEAVKLDADPSIGSDNSDGSGSNLAFKAPAMAAASTPTVATIATVAVATTPSGEVRLVPRLGRTPLSRADERSAEALATLEAAGVRLWVGSDGGLRWSDDLPVELRRLVIDYRQDLTTDILARELDPNALEYFEERAAIAEFDGDADRNQAEASALRAAGALSLARLPAEIEDELRRTLNMLGVPEPDHADYRRNVAEHITREGKASALNWLRALCADNRAGGVA